MFFREGERKQNRKERKRTWVGGKGKTRMMVRENRVKLD
jgi:hypothetical protein